MNKSLSTTTPTFEGRRWDYKFIPDLFESAEFFQGIRTKRIFAYFIDWCLIGLIFLVLGTIGIVFAVVSFGLLAGPVGLVLAAIPFAYHILFVSGQKQATPGMRMMGLKVYSWDGTAPDLLQSALMFIAFYVTAILGTPFILIISVLNGRGRCLHDYLCGVFVVNDLEVYDGE